MKYTFPTNDQAIRFFRTYGIIAILVCIGSAFLWRGVVSIVRPLITHSCEIGQLHTGNHVVINGEDYTVTNFDVYGSIGSATLRMEKQ